MARQDFKQRVIFELVDQASGPAGKIASSIDGIAGKLVAIGAAGLVGKAFGELVTVLNAGAAAAAESETATVRLGAALANGAPGATAFADSLLRQAEALQKLGSVNQEAVQGVQALLANLGVAGSQLSTATQAAVDLSAALGIGLDAAAVQVGKTVNGVTGRLGQLVPELAALSKEALAAGEGIQVLAERFGGQAQAQAVTYANSIARLNEALQDTSEVLGGSGASEGVANAIRNLAFAIEQANQAAEGSALTTFFGELKQGSIDLGATLVTQGAFLLESVGLFGQQTEATRAAVAASREAEAAFQREAVALEARAASQRQAAESQAAFLAATKELGVTLEAEGTAKLEANNALLIQADELYRAGVITRADFERVSRAIAEAEREVRAELAGTAESLKQAETGYFDAKVAAEDYRAEVTALAAASNAAAAAVYGLGNALGVVARDGRNQALVDASVAAGNVPYLGGTRIRVPGGSRLVGR